VKKKKEIHKNGETKTKTKTLKASSALVNLGGSHLKKILLNKYNSLT